MIAGGRYHNVGLNSNGVAVAWGSDYEGQCDLPAGLSSVMAVAAGAHHSMLLLDGEAPAPRLFNSIWAASRFRVRVQSQARKNYALEFKDSLLNSSWTSLSTNHGNGALLQLQDAAASSGRRFYRVRQW
jgi:hypothetical protein